MNPFEQFSQLFLRPEVMFILMLMVIYGIMGELSSPGAILPGVVGAIALILVLYMSAILPVNITGLVLIGLALRAVHRGCLCDDAWRADGGRHRDFFPRRDDAVQPGRAGLRLVAALDYSGDAADGAVFHFCRRQRHCARSSNPAQTGTETMIGKTVNALSRIDSAGGKVFIEGEIWNAVSETPVEAGQAVEITGIDGTDFESKTKKLKRKKLWTHSSTGILSRASASVVIVIVMLAIFILPQAVRILREYERGVIFRLGKLQGAKGPGLIFLIPIVDNMVKMDLRVVTIDVPKQEIMTKDNVPATVDAVIYFRVVDPNAAVVKVENFWKATSLIGADDLAQRARPVAAGRPALAARRHQPEIAGDH